MPFESSAASSFALAATTKWPKGDHEAGRKMPFVHALDTVHRSARCLDLPWKGSQNQLWNVRLRLNADGRKLLVVVSPRVKPMTIGVPG